MNPTANNEWSALLEEHEIAYLRGDLATSSPQSYTLEEKRSISEAMDASTAAIDAAMRADFEQMPSEMQRLMLDMLGAPGSPERDWWERILLNFDSIPDAPPVTA